MPDQLILPDGSPTTDDEVNETERKRERSSEDEKYVAVIIERTDAKERTHAWKTLER